MRPIVGISTYVEPASWAVWQRLDAALLPFDYVRMVTAAGARAVLLPPDDVDADVLDVLDALVLAGGADIGPELYAATPGPLTDTRADRDAGEVRLARAALERDLPVLGVCRGMQLLVALAGGRLHQHLPDVVAHEGHRPAPGVYGTHPVRFAAGSLIAALMGDDTEVNSYHHQGVSDVGSLTATGWADDGVVEAVEDPGRRFLLGVQWHPEAARDVRLFRALVTAATG